MACCAHCGVGGGGGLGRVLDGGDWLGIVGDVEISVSVECDGGEE